MANNGSLKPYTISVLSALLQQENIKEWKDLEQSAQQSSFDEASFEEAKKWLEFAKEFKEECKDSSKWQEKLQSLNSHLLRRSVISGLGLALSIVDFVVFVALRDTMINNVIPNSQDEYQNVIRWFDYVQDQEKVASLFQKISIKKSVFNPPDFSDVLVRKPAKPEPATSKGTAKEKQPDSTSKTEDKNADKIDEKKPKLDDPSIQKKGEGKGKGDATPAQKKDDKKEPDVSVSLLDIRVGQVVKVWKHPSADSLLVEEIDMGDIGVRQVVSGLAKYLKEEEMLNRKVAVIANVKPGKLRDVMSSGLVLCASNSDHTIVEPLLVPAEASVGEKITFSGHDGKPEDVLNPKKKQLEKILPDLVTDDNCIATYGGVPFMTSAGPCKSSLAKAAIK